MCAYLQRATASDAGQYCSSASVCGFEERSPAAAQSFGVKLAYYDRHQKPEIDAMGVAWFQDLEAMVSRCDIVTINVRRCPLP